MDDMTREWYDSMGNGEQIQYRLNVWADDTYFIVRGVVYNPREYFESM